MLQGKAETDGNGDELPYDPQIAAYEKIMEQAIPDGWKLVPVDPTAEMISSGITAHYERSQIQIHDRPAPGPMECAYVAMLSAAPVNPEFITQWIPCSERLPPEATMVLGRCDNDYDFVNLLGGHLKIFCMGEWRILPGAEITHWMPLPAAPQQEAE